LPDFDKNYKLLSEAANLLSDRNLIWSEDFEAIRKPLAAWVTNEVRNARVADPNAIKLAKALTRE
jgi:hypothetical protein